MMNRRAMLSGSAALALAGPAMAQAVRRAPPAAAAPTAADAAADRAMASMAEQMLREYPENASSLGIDTGARATLKRRLTDRSPAGYRAQARGAAERLAALRRLNPARLSGQTRVNAEAAIYAHQTAVEGYRFPYGDVQNLNGNWAYANTPYVVNPGTGFFNGVPDFLNTSHTIAPGSRADADAYLARLEAFATGLDGETERVRADAARGVIMPDYLLDTTVRQISGYRAQPVGEWGLVTSLDRRAPDLEQGPDYRAQAERICRERVGPAMDRQVAALTALRPRATGDAGVWKLPDGEAYYAWTLKASTTTTRSADEIHRLGVQQNEELKAEMDRLLRAQGLTQGTVGARMTALGRDPRHLWPNTDGGRAALLAYLNEVTADIRARMPRAFRNLPDAPMEIRRVPEAIQDGAPNGYASAGSIDGSRPGVYHINLKDTANWPKFSLPTLTFHEGIPGHIWQGNYQNRLPLILSLLSFNAYTEGWALYAETLADDLGFYETDPLGKLGYLQSMQFRACRLVVDTGMHAKRWDRERCVRFMVEETGRPEGAMRAEVNRYGFWPGQACGYKVGHNEMLRQRERARARLGARFDLRDFDDAVIRNGSVPLDVLNGIVDRWLAGQGAERGA